MQVTRLQHDRDAAVRKDGGQQHERITDQRGGTHCSGKGSEGAGNQRFRTAHGARGGRETGNQGTLPHGNGREHGGTGHQHCINSKSYIAQKSVSINSGPDSIVMHTFMARYCFCQSSKMMMNNSLFNSIWQAKAIYSREIHRS